MHKSKKLTLPDEHVLELKDRGDGTYWTVLDGKMTGWGTWLSEAQKEVLQDLETEMILGSTIEFSPRHVDPLSANALAMIASHEEGNWDSRDGKPHKIWNVKPNDNSLKSKTMSNQNQGAKCSAEVPRTSQLETIQSLAQELVDQQANLKDRLESLADRLLGGQPQDPQGLEDRCDNGKLDQIESALRLALRYGSDGHHQTGRLSDQM
jgi:hypothetical protein